MKKQLAYGLMLLAGIGLLAACSSNKKSLGEALQTNDLVFTGNPENVPSKINVYHAMARAAKYNSDTAAQNTLKKIYNGAENPKEIAEKILTAGQSKDKLYNAAKALDFADVYAMSVLTDNEKFIENTLYAKSAQNLTIAAIKLHREEIFAEKELKEISRISSPQEKILKNLTAKMNSGDGLTEPEINYRKGLEVALNRLDEIRNQLIFVRSEYVQLVKVSGKDLDLEGKRFYELDDFDKKYQPDLFQDSAVINRREFSLAKERLGSFNAAKARRQAYVDYPPVARLDINGLEIEDSRYENALYNKARTVVFNLLDAVEAYRVKPSNEKLMQKAFDELAATVLTQVELTYRLVQKASFAYEDNRYKIDEMKKIIRAMEKKGSLPDYEKIDLLNRKVELISLEWREAKVLADRAASLRQLYYLSGLSPFSKNMLKEPVKDIEVVLRQAFNRDLITMLSAVKENPRWDDGGNAWAHKDKWLDELIDGPQKSQETQQQARHVAKEENFEESKSEKTPDLLVAARPVTKSSEERSVSKKLAETKGVLQLGVYNEMQNAIDDQKEIVSAVAALKGIDVFIEDGYVNGHFYHRLLVKTAPDNLEPLCQQIKDSGYDCLIK